MVNISYNCVFRRRSRKAELLARQQTSKKAPAVRQGENVLVERCSECNAVLEQYDDDTIGLCIIALATFIHREPGLATPMLLDMLQCVSRWVFCLHVTAWFVMFEQDDDGDYVF